MSDLTVCLDCGLLVPVEQLRDECPVMRAPVYVEAAAIDEQEGDA